MPDNLAGPLMGANSGQVVVRRPILLMLSMTLSACATNTVKVWPAADASMANDAGIVVQAGDSLYGIAARNGVGAIDLALANGIAEPFIIHPGERLRLPVHASSKAPAPSAPAIRMEALPEHRAASKPVATNPASAPTATTSQVADNATAIAKTATHDDARWRWPAEGTVINAPARTDATAYALDIAGTAGSPVRAAAAGTVLYSGEGSPGYEQLVVIEHAGGWVSSYSHNRRRRVTEGQAVSVGTVIADMGRVGASRDMVHFELRRAGQLIDPRTVLPPR